MNCFIRGWLDSLESVFVRGLNRLAPLLVASTTDFPTVC